MCIHFIIWKYKLKILLLRKQQVSTYSTIVLLEIFFESVDKPQKWDQLLKIDLWVKYTVRCAVIPCNIGEEMDPPPGAESPSVRKL
jgi:hypothetical protein